MSIKKSSQSGFSNRSIMYVPPTGGTTAVRVGLNASGGIEEDFVIDGKTYRSHTFNSSDSFIISSFYSSNTDCELVVAAGGGSANSSEKGGGGGGVVYYGSETGCMRVNTGTSLTNLAVGTYTVTVGAGGAGGSNATGGTSSFVGPNYNISASGGFYGNIMGTNTYNAGNYTANHYTTQFGLGYPPPAGGVGGGGGGAWPDNGSAGTSDNFGGGAGGLGCAFRFIRPGGLFVGGGGSSGVNGTGYGYNWQTRQRMSSGFSGGIPGLNAAANSGGGSGGSWNNVNSRSGGSGVVVIKYRIY